MYLRSLASCVEFEFACIIAHFLRNWEFVIVRRQLLLLDSCDLDLTFSGLTCDRTEVTMPGDSPYAKNIDLSSKCEIPS